MFGTTWLFKYSLPDSAQDFNLLPHLFLTKSKTYDCCAVDGVSGTGVCIQPAEETV